jgi:hypothetical protein
VHTPWPEGVLFFMIKQKIIRDKMRYSNLSNNNIMGPLKTSNSSIIRLSKIAVTKVDFAVPVTQFAFCHK